MSISDNLETIRSEIPQGVRLVAVSKFHPVSQLAEAYAAGQRIFGESRVQELAAKIPQLPADIRWHFIGHLQTNKVRALLSTRAVALIESVDSIRLLDAIDAESERLGIVTRVLLQVHVAREETKFGFLPEEIADYFAGRNYERLKATHICGLMAMASNTDDEDRVRSDFRLAATLMQSVNATTPDIRDFDILSMGMSDDWHIAVSEGSNMIRIGTAIFGVRE